MVSIGNTILPGVQTTIESASSTGVNVGAPGQVGLVGQADLSNGTANANELYEVRTPVKARNLFGTGSMLAEAVVDALTEGAYPVYSVAATETDETGEDISGLSSTNGTLANAPVSEDPSDVRFTVDGTEFSTVVTHDDPSGKAPASAEAYYNPVTGEFELGAAPSSSGSVDYTHYDYDSAVDALIAESGAIVDFLGVVNENTAAVNHALSAVETAVSQYQFMIVVAGAGVGDTVYEPSTDTVNFTASHDSSRLQLLYPSRSADGESIVGAYLGLRASLGMTNSPIFKRLDSITDLSVTLSKAAQEVLVGENVVPVADEYRGARIVEDLTCVDEANMEEDSMRQALHRLIVDYTTEVVHEASQRFIGELHTQAARNSLRSIIVSELNRMMGLNALTGFTITVEPVDAMTASVDVGIDTIDPLRNIVATISAGQIEGTA